MTIVPIERVRQEVEASVLTGADLDTAIHAAAVRLGLPREAVLQALEAEEHSS